jgi:hypothetical protein
MPDEKFEFTIICNQKQARAVMNAVDKLGIKYELAEERAFDPSSPDVALKIILTVAQLLPIAAALLKTLKQNNAYAEFETRHKLAKKMLSDLEPLKWIKGEDRENYSYYEFKTARCKHYWKLDGGVIAHGPLRCT